MTLRHVLLAQLGVSDAYPLQGATGHVLPKARFSAPCRQERWEEQTGGEISSARTNRRV
jgi:hypothetical protein